MTKPFVYIVGAGPGDVELLTLKAHRLITSTADVLLYDRLVPDAIIALAPAHVEKIYAGKSCHNHHMTQEEIHEVMLREARKGKTIVRLKGGDPFVFGRGGEEAAFLRSHNIPFEIVPGVTAASACSSIMGIPLTHRGLATAVQYITGHQQSGQPIALNWDKLADPDTTLVIYMGLANLEQITEQLALAGMERSTPAIAIQEASTPNQRYVKATLSDIYRKTKEAAMQAPTLVIIGKVVSLHLSEEA